MKAARFEQFGGRITVEVVPDPTPPDGGVVVEVRANGVCRSDWHGWVGHDPSIRLPHVPGHEMSGVVAAVGSGVDAALVGRRVTVPFVMGCGKCEQCRTGNQQVCENQFQAGFSGWGSFARYVALPFAEENLVPLPDEMSFATAAGLGCRFATAFRAVVDQGAVVEGTTVAVWGSGGVGLSAVMIASALGARVVAVDISDDALDLAKSCGASAVVNSMAVEDPVVAVREHMGGGVQVSLDTLGSTGTAVASIRSLATRGRHVQVGLMIGDDARPVIPMWRLHASEIELFGSHGMQAWRYPEMLEMIAGGQLDPDTLVTHTFDLGAGIDHLTRMDTFPGTGFAVITDFPE
ncbi:MAG: alcohol dehydrogenase catalytic domain-containing protein [Proteobacteria bacterium]|nr:alcohol dehydrogenase catalytic domain-containing protein [Pseudomonadota bacterium]